MDVTVFYACESVHNSPARCVAASGFYRPHMVGWRHTHAAYYEAALCPGHCYAARNAGASFVFDTALVELVATSWFTCPILLKQVWIPCSNYVVVPCFPWLTEGQLLGLVVSHSGCDDSSSKCWIRLTGPYMQHLSAGACSKTGDFDPL